MNITIKPSVAKGTIKAPPSKSMAHRLLICAGLCEGRSTIHNLAYSEDIKATIDCLRALGAKVTLDGDNALVEGITKAEPLNATLNCRESGSTLRFFIPICLLSNGTKVLNGSETLLSRPLSVYEDLFSKTDINMTRGESITLNGKLKPGNYTIPGNISSQFITGLLFALPLLDGDSTITLTPPIESRSYIDMTIMAEREFGVDIEWGNPLATKGGPLPFDKGRLGSDTNNDCATLYIKGNQAYLPREATVEGDYSNAAFLDAFNLIGGSVTTEGLKAESLQGDKIYIDYFKSLCNGTPTLDISNCPDLGPILIAMAALMHGAILTGTKRLKIKESDRGQVMHEELLKLGMDITINENSIVIPDQELKPPTEPLDSHNDHRIVMSLSVILSKLGGTIKGAEAVSKSYPNFFDDIKRLGISSLDNLSSGEAN